MMNSKRMPTVSLLLVMFAGVLGLLFLVGCGSARTVSISPTDPTQASASEAAAPLPEPSLKAEASDRFPTQPATGPSEMKGMDHSAHQPSQTQLPPPAEGTDPELHFTCPMHPEVKSSKPGTCPICSMKLVERKPESPDGMEG